MYVIMFEEEEDKKLFDMLQDMVRQGLKPTSIHNCTTVMEIHGKIKAISIEGDGSLCAYCGHVKRAPSNGQNFNRQLTGGALKLENSEYNMLMPAFEAFPKHPDSLDNFMKLYAKFKEARKE